jgi:4-hydroxy-3-methylbut-2-enyl diphosphate reductase
MRGRRPGVTTRASGPSQPRLLLFVPLAVEAAAIRGVTPGALVVRTGMGRERAEQAAQKAAALRADAVAVTGFCGALRDGLRPGDVVVATEVRAPDGTVVRCSPGPLVAALKALGIDNVRVGPIVSSESLVRGDERDALAANGALAADMESAWLAGGAAGRPFAVLRVVVDSPSRELSQVFATSAGGLKAVRSLRRAAPALSRWASATGERAVLLASPRSFCAGAQRAIEIVERALELFGPPVYVRKQIVHNAHVCATLERAGAVFVDHLAALPPGSLCVLSAHGVSPQVREEAAERGVRVIDATCPLVGKVHREARRFAGEGYSIVLIGHKGHDEVEGTSGEAPHTIHVVQSADQVDELPLDSGDRVAFLTQTTLAIDEVERVVAALRLRFPDLVGPSSDDICYATSNRQHAVKDLARECDLVLVIGSANSSNSKRLVEITEREGCPAKLIEDENELDPAWLVGAGTVGITAGASAPNELVDRVVAALASFGRVDAREVAVVDESMHFMLPPELRDGPEDERAIAGVHEDGR